MWKRSRLRAKRNIPESMPTSAIAMKNERMVNNNFSRRSFPPERPYDVRAKLTRRDVGREFHTVTTGYIQRNGRDLWTENMRNVVGKFKLSPPEMAFIPRIRLDNDADKRSTMAPRASRLKLESTRNY